MKTLETPLGNKITIYSSAKELPITRYNELQKQLLLISGIGSSVEDANARYVKMLAYLAENKIEDAKLEIVNSRATFLSIMGGVNYNTKAFACFVKSIDGVECEDITEDGLYQTMLLIEKTGLTQEQSQETVEALKKK